jgi:hypothetical protein
MKATTVELPPLVRAAEGHVLYPPGPTSICPNHKFCAYTGDEPDRCAECHGTFDTNGFCPCSALPPGRLSPCFCVRCEELFTSITAFDKHIHKATGKHRSPERVGLVLVEQNGWQLWANPGSRPEIDE